MPKIQINQEGQGMVLPKVGGQEFLAGEEITLRANPAHGFRVASVSIGGTPQKPVPQHTIVVGDSDIVVDVVFAKSYLNRVSQYTLTNGVNGILLKATLSKIIDDVWSSVKVYLVNPSHSVALTLDTNGASVLSHTVSGGSARLATRSFQASLATPICVQFEIRQEKVFCSTLDGNGVEISRISGTLGPSLEDSMKEGWLVVVEGSAATHGAYAIDISEFFVTADDKRPLVSVGSMSSTHIQEATNLEG
jgi:hypothetical protein